MADLVPSLVSVLDALRELPLLKPDQLNAIILQDLQGAFPDPPALGKELLQRGWLTPYQVNQLLQDKGDELLLGRTSCSNGLARAGPAKSSRLATRK